MVGRPVYMDQHRHYGLHVSPSPLSETENFSNTFSMAGAATYPPNFEAAFAESQVSPGPVITSIGVPKDRSLTDQVVGLMQCVYSYGGAML
jgi:hypothetical protein